MNSEIDNLVSRCPQCLTHGNQQQKETLIQHTVPKVPWTKVASDLFTLYGHSYVIVTDYTSKYIEIERLPDKSSLNVMNKIKKIFTLHRQWARVHRSKFQVLRKRVGIQTRHLKPPLPPIKRVSRESDSNGKKVAQEGT